MAATVTPQDLEGIEQELATLKARVEELEALAERLRAALGTQGVVVE